jgi:hypothetical protein
VVTVGVGATAVTGARRLKLPIYESLTATS